MALVHTAGLRKLLALELFDQLFQCLDTCVTTVQQRLFRLKLRFKCFDANPGLVETTPAAAPMKVMIDRSISRTVLCFWPRTKAAR